MDPGSGPSECRAQPALERTAFSAGATLILELLRASESGISEFDLIQALRGRDDTGLARADLRDNLTLFHVHFLLFHTLYRLRDELWSGGEGHLDISPLCIALRPYEPAVAGLAAHDPLREYYLDLNHLEQTSAEDVGDLLAQFWLRTHAGEHRAEALRVLGLQDPVDRDTIKRTYRRLAMQHHPDRGGDKARLQELNEAMAWLAKSEHP